MYQSKIQILIAEDHALVRQGLVALMESPEFVITEVDNGLDAASCLKSGEYDLALLDIGLPRRTGLDVLIEMRQRGIDTKIILMTGDTDHHAPRDMYAAGADAFLYKIAEADHLLETIRAVLNGERVKANEAYDGESLQRVAEFKSRLSERELQVTKLVVEGQSNKSIAQALFISEHTVRKHREHINRKLDVRSPAVLATFAIKAGLV